MRDRLLRDIRQHRVGAAKSNDRGFAEEEAFVKKRALPAQREADRDRRRGPEREANQEHANGSSMLRLSVRRCLLFVA